jgi:BirA family biotin operon repressor/biotin-[acetyl-CoA-carboxylase] ligase
MKTRLAILQLLADGELRSGADIGRRLGITRAAVHKGVKALAANGLGVQAVAGLGYRLEAPVVPLDRERIARALEGNGESSIRIDVLECVDSTNRQLLSRALVDSDPSGMVCLAEVQPQGRGRQEKSWVATPYENLTMSIAWRFHAGPAMVMGLSLAAGVAAVRALEIYGVADAGLKWPNDILWNGRKLAGLLVDVHGEASGPCTVVVGIGVNCRIGESEKHRIDQPWIDLHTILKTTIDRNKLSALLIGQLEEMFRCYAVSGLAAYKAEWNRRHLYTDRAVRLVREQTAFEGIVDGIDDHGALRLLDAEGRLRLFHSGEVSFRAVAECVS